MKKIIIFAAGAAAGVLIAVLRINEKSGGANYFSRQAASRQGCVERHSERV
jgi:hypothetical protein